MTFLLSGTSKNVVFPSYFFCLLLSLSYFPEKKFFFFFGSRPRVIMPSFINAVSFVDYRLKTRDGKFNNIIKKFRKL